MRSRQFTHLGQSQMSHRAKPAIRKQISHSIGATHIHTKVNIASYPLIGMLKWSSHGKFFFLVSCPIKSKALIITHKVSAPDGSGSHPLKGKKKKRTEKSKWVFSQYIEKLRKPETNQDPALCFFFFLGKRETTLCLNLIKKKTHVI